MEKTTTNAELPRMARELYRQAQSLQKCILDMYLRELIELDEQEQQPTNQEARKT